jgi:hypothetical protein
LKEDFDEFIISLDENAKTSGESKLKINAKVLD